MKSNGKYYIALHGEVHEVSREVYQENRFAGFDVTAQAVHTDTDHGTETGTVR